MRAKLAISTLCENPVRKTGLSSLFPEFISHARKLYPDVSWLVFAGDRTRWPGFDPGVELCAAFPSNEKPLRRLFADHFRVAAEARRRGASAIVTVGFVPIRRCGIPVSMQVFAVDHLLAGGLLRSAYRRWAIARGLRRAALVITNSEWTKSQLGEATAPVIVSPEGLRHDVFCPTGESGMAGVPNQYLLWVSNLYPYKRFELAIAAYARLPRSLRLLFPLVVVGGEWPGGGESAHAAADRLGVLGDVLFLGWVRDEILPSMYRGARAHILSSSQETFGRSVLESMACGCPSVIQDLPVFREFAGEAAIFTDYSNSEAAATALERICIDDALRALLANQAVDRARRYSFERLARERVEAILATIGARFK